jgi:hypothetical protein
MLENEEVKAALLKLESINKEEMEEILAELVEAQEELEELAAEMHGNHDTILDALVGDGLIKNTKKRVKMQASRGEIEVNGKKYRKISKRNTRN